MREDTRTKQEIEQIVMSEHKKIKTSLVGTALSTIGAVTSSYILISSYIFVNADSNNIKYAAIVGLVASGLATVYNLRNYSESLGPFFSNLNKLKDLARRK